MEVNILEIFFVLALGAFIGGVAVSSLTPTDNSDYAELDKNYQLLRQEAVYSIAFLQRDLNQTQNQLALCQASYDQAIQYINEIGAN